MFHAGAPMVAERPDRRMKPGELQNGGYGFYYKGRQGNVTPAPDVLQNLQAVITPITNRPRNQEPGKPYKELIASPVYFSNEKWQECLSSHGIHIDAEAKTMTVQSESSTVDMVYDLTDEELKALASGSVKDFPPEKRLEILNGIIQNDFSEKVTIDMLNGKDHIAIALYPDVEKEFVQEQQVIQDSPSIQHPLTENIQANVISEHQLKEGAAIDGKDLELLNENKGWYREGRHGREIQVDEISVRPSETEGKYRMTAIINGQSISHEISQKQYDKFLAVDDYHRMKLFSKVFDEVDMKTRPEANSGLGTQILAALTAGVVVTSEVAHGLSRHPHPAPEIYEERFAEAPRPYFKPGVDTPREVAARNFEAQMNKEVTEIRRGY